ncbi:uroporphyrinogen-III C-methyltransferase [Curvibacter sp. CHRR-16]|uniref:uroporphyrinogen-III C-methyltransferase n=1 Tax=Curvibacter sp. CHRR-16 TaxID=2835872 RepID=UPI001BDB05A9|nr:uroporphyrinogen-III C-methyltransferase [Curvibacter sp. CHRR-16]MBT0570806.1 uroporphyrinogen-III C-methyltransferase [Curvibacter sp. CHRR-16]
MPTTPVSTSSLTLCPGSVTLVGAGPGDPGLLTLHAVQAIAQASVLLVDDLVNDTVLQHAAPGARIIHVGKRGGCVSTPQSFIEKLMITAAREGECVVRLKGGDPFIFGRGGEEVEHLQAAGVPVQVVHGITAGLAALGRLQVPLTHRDHAHGVLFMTGHSKPGGQAPDWALLGQTVQQCKLTLLIYMGMGQLEGIQAGLLNSLADTTPAAIIQHASLPTQRHVVCTLANLHATAAREHMGSPSVVVVGDVLQGLAQLASTTDDTATTFMPLRHAS